MGKPGRVADTRELVVHTHYILVYACKEDSIAILTVETHQNTRKRAKEKAACRFTSRQVALCLFSLARWQGFEPRTYRFVASQCYCLHVYPQGQSRVGS